MQCTRVDVLTPESRRFSLIAMRNVKTSAPYSNSRDGRPPGRELPRISLAHECGVYGVRARCMGQALVCRVVLAGALQLNSWFSCAAESCNCDQIVICQWCRFPEVWVGRSCFWFCWGFAFLGGARALCFLRVTLLHFHAPPPPPSRASVPVAILNVVHQY